MTDDDHLMERRMTVLDQNGATVIVICSCGEKCKARSDIDAQRAHFAHVLEKNRDGEVPF